MQKFLKILLIIGLSLGFLIIVTLTVVFIKLPSVSSIGQALSANKKEKPKVRLVEKPAQTPAPAVAATSGDYSAVPDAARSVVETEAHKRAHLALMDDILSNEKPLSDFCASLKNAKNELFTSNEQVDAALMNSINEEKDPRIQALKPTFRFMMRLPKMNDLIRQAQSAEDSNDESYFKKAEFYAQAFSAFNEIKDHKADLEAVMDRSYYFINLNKLIALKPAILDDSRVQNYCNQVEQAFNQARPVTRAEERNEFISLLNTIGVRPEEIHYNPNYKTNIEFEMSAQNISLKGSSWLDEIFQTQEPEPANETPAQPNQVN